MMGRLAVAIVAVLIGSAAALAADSSCEDTKAKLDVYAQVLVSSRAQAEQQVATMAVELQRVKQENEALKKELSEAKAKKPAKEDKPK